MTTPQNPYGPQGRPDRPYNPGPHTGPQGHPRHQAPVPQAPVPQASVPEASWGAGPQQGYRAPATNGHSRFEGEPAGYAPSRTAPPMHTAQPMHTAPPMHTAQPTHTAPAGGWRDNPVPPQRSGGHPVPEHGRYGAPQYPSSPQPQQPPRNGFGVTALVLGILGVLFAMIPIIGLIAWPLAIIGLIFGLLGIARTRSGAATNTGVAISGTVLSAIALILCIVWVAAVGSAVSSAPTTAGSLPAASGGGTAQAGGAFPGATSDDVVGNAGDALTIGDMQITATALKPGDSTLGKTLCSTVTYRNNGSTPAQFSGIGDWKLQDPAGAALMTGFTGSTNILSTGELAPGGSTTGDMCFDRNASASGQYVLLYKPMLSFSSDRGAWLNQVG